MLGDLCQQFKFVLTPAPAKVIANSPNHKYLLLLHSAYHRPAALQAAISHSGDGPRPLPYRALEPRGGIEPPHVHGVVHGRRFRFCFCTRHIYAIPLNYHTTVLVATSRMATRAAVFSVIAHLAGHSCHRCRLHDRRTCGRQVTSPAPLDAVGHPV